MITRKFKKNLEKILSICHKVNSGHIFHSCIDILIAIFLKYKKKMKTL